jgi:MATE family multidrug resistance protein
MYVGLPGAMSLFMEWGSYEMMAGISGQLGQISLATHGVFMTTASLFYMVPLAIADSTSTIIGNFLGNSQPEEAECVAKLGMSIDFTWGLVAGSILFTCFRSLWGTVFTNDPDVLRMIYRVMPIIFLYLIIDSMKCITLTILRSTGRPSITAWGNMLSCWFVMLPLAWFLGLHLHYDLYGIWGAMSVGWFVSTAMYLYTIMTTDWNYQVELANKRNTSEIVITS